MALKMSRLWVDPKFKKKLKQEAASKDISLLHLTREMADDSLLCKDKKKRGGLFGDLKF